MTLVGRFGARTGRPYIDARLYLARLSVVADLTFVVDTGADRSYLAPGDATRMGVDYRRLDANASFVVGAGGRSRGFVERAIVVFQDERSLYLYDLDLVIAEPGPELAGLPSLLGRDVIDRWRLSYRRPANQLTAEVDSADLVMPLNPGFGTVAPDAIPD